MIDMSTQSNESTQARPTNEQYGAKFLREGIVQRVRCLRDLADRIECDGEREIAQAEQGKGTYARVACEMVHEITWGVANLHLDTLISTAADADIARAKGE